MNRLKLVLIGAGSTVFTQRLVADIILSGETDRWELALVDIDPITLTAVDALVRKMLALKGVDLPITSKTDRRDVLRGADFVVTTIAVGGRRGWELDVQVPRKHGIYQPVGDTMMPGGISRALRMIPQMVAIAEDVAELCPDAHFFNYSNPMTAVCRAIRLKTGVPVVGLCHGLHHVEGVLARFLGRDEGSISSFGVGLNHLTFLTHIYCDGQDAMPLLEAKLDEQRPLLQQEIREKTDWPNTVTGRAPRYSDDPFAWSIFERYGVFPVALDRHITEFYPERFPGGRYYGRTLGVDAFSIDGRIALGDTWFDEMLAVARSLDPLPASYFENVPGESEQLLEMMQSLLLDRRHVFSVNMPNGGAVPGMPHDAVLELPAAATGAGFAPLQSKALPPALAAKLLSKVAAIEVTVEAALSGRFDLLVEALLTDGSVTDPDAATALARDLVAAHKSHLPQFS
ncbi:alpha-glucosidase/alpha-galactosidase [soil metagenome]